MALLVHKCIQNDGEYPVEIWEEIEPKQWKLIDIYSSDTIVQIVIKFCPFCGEELK